MITDEQIRALQDRLYRDPDFGHSKWIARALSDCYVALNYRDHHAEKLPARARCWELYQSGYLEASP